MTIVRQDAWTKDEDLLLAEVVLRHIREGSTQLKAFEEVGQKLNRTPAACGFRWNSFVRKQYKTGIELAKKQRKQLKKNPQTLYEVNVEKIEEIEQPTRKYEKLSLDQIITYLEQFKEKEKKIESLSQELESLKERYQTLEKKEQEATRENEMLKKENKALKDDYLALLSIMEKARKLAVKEDENNVRMKFQMDPNGNLDVIRNK
ncbi:RsfA family transcriptional regulator [Caldibacillus thermolactis]|jgi:prespore-specific regulator|uniref:RsfA family transcriptional regulator n=1 Tax=Pallidibacillus thermolactis TaxID=251051 RepID=A0ABT2WH79_9BACI|nr:RsfA family transcriptional regulator [Pallidibacillus thermolactis]MCU9595043.1 RsfA family transcriptional regulator [Pallidibacillus thermolactis]MCU9600360.1 RsfA family transcriptional regulator [Pallidibacillus thermolactis subsp. kokeshiiformis]MED1672218.1 RsfA family transcriptional regulator [Pallidibacillus thermolactis subsp. kokeshiiformis]